MKRLLVALSTIALALFTPIFSAQASHVWTVNLYSLGDSGIRGSATLTDNSDGTVRVAITATGLKSGVQYISGVYTRASNACSGGLIRAQTASGFSDNFTSTQGGITYIATAPLSNIWAISVRETTDGRAPGTPRACGERWLGSLGATVQQEGTTATVTLRLYNLTDDTINLADIRAPIPAGMSVTSSSPTASLVSNELRWVHVAPIAPGATRVFTFKLNTSGQRGTVQAWAALIGSQSNTSTVSQARTITAPAP